MAGSYTPTGTFSNLTRLELEQLRKSDFTANRKALTVGDAATGAENAVGRGSLLAEPYSTGPSVRLDDLYALSAPAAPGPGLLTTTSPGGLSSETVRWWGPEIMYDSFASGYATAADTWQDDTLPSSFIALGVQAGDILLVKPTSAVLSDQNASVVGTITVVGASTLTLSNIWNPENTSTNLSFGGSDKYSYLIIRPTAVQLFAVPGSGPVGREQTFLFVQPGAAIHNQKAPTAADIEAARITDIVPPGSNPAVDRSDFVYDLNPNGRGQLQQSLATLGYRVILYPGLPGSGVDLTKPISAVNPIIDSTLPRDDQRVTIDYKAGIVRFSCAPLSLGDINPNGGLNATTGRLQLFAVFWSYDTALTRGNARGLWAQRSDTADARPPGRIYFNTTPVNPSLYATHPQGWRVGTSTTPDHNAYIKAMGEERPLSDKSQYPFLAPWERRSVEFGTIDTDSGFLTRGLRYLSYRPLVGWTFQSNTSDFKDYFGYGESERVLADKTALTYSDTSSPAQGFADQNPPFTYGASPYGARSHNILVQSTLATNLLGSSYGTAHFRRGTYYIQDAIAVPPGSIIEGEGHNTRFVFRNFESVSGISKRNGLFKIGPNTGWGVYDASAAPSSGAPYQTSLNPVSLLHATPGERIEGMDLVWNPVRRTWAMVYADVTTGAVIFNEFRPDGTSLFLGNGVNIKDTLGVLYSSSSSNGEHHSGGHYPRLAYQQHTNEYVVVWVEEYDNAGFIGPRVHLRYFQLAVDAASVGGWKVEYPYGASTEAALSHTFSDHPSIAVEDYSVYQGSYWACLTFWSYDDTVGGQINGSAINRRYYQNGVEFSSFLTALQDREVCSSTDVKADESGGFLSVFSVRAHRFLRGTNGTITVAGPESYVTDPSFNFDDEHVAIGSKFFLLISTASSAFNGITTCVVYDTAGGGGTQARIKDERGAALGADGPGITWAMTPPVRINGVRSRLQGGFQVESPLQAILQQNLPAFYQLEMREPDYVRLSRGAASWCVAFQGYNSVGWPAFGQADNYDFGYNLSPTSAGIIVGDPNVYREHISTCAIILRDDGRAVFPSSEVLATGATGALVDPTSPQFFSRSMRDNEVSLKSLGTRPPLTERPNYQSLFGGLRVPYNETREVSFANYSYRWTDTGVNPGVLACIPGITWTGQDWVIVSPSKPGIHSFTGYYQPDGFGDSYLSDVMFYFGEDDQGSDNNGWPLRRTLPTFGSEIYFPAGPLSSAIVNAVDEHTVRLSGEPLGAGPLTQVEWMLVLPQTPDAAGIKNQGFRINPEGRVITSTSFTTWADEPDPTDKAYWKREIELMRRPTIRGGNYPSQVAGGGTESNDPLEPGSRIKGNINFRGVAPGRPKGTNQHTAYMSPKIAVAWGENLYGLVDQIIEGSFSPVSRLEFYRQSFGPYNVTLRNFTIEATPTSALEVLSRAHVYTRHYSPVASNVSFDTDGFRNVFVYPGSRVVTWYDATYGIEPVSSFIGAVYTDAQGQNPIKMQGPLLARGDLDLWCSDVTEDVAVANSDDLTRTYGQGTGPKVLWDGQRFAVVWIERANRPVVGSGGLEGGFHGQGYQLSLSFLPGSEDAGLQSSDLIYPLDLDTPLLPLASTTIEDGTGWSLSNGTNTYNLSLNTVAVCDVAFSGKVYAVVWAAGLAPDYDTTHTKGSALGVTIFGLDSATPATTDVLLGKAQPGGGRTYIIEQTSEPGSFHNPKIVWDGAQFVVFFEVTVLADTASPPNLNTALAFAFVPEEGMARPSEMKMQSGPSVSTGTPYVTGYVGAGAPYDAIPNAAGFLGFALAKENLAPGAPYYGANHTVILLWGNQIEIASNATLGGLGLTTGGTVNFSGAGDFVARGVRPGDILVITGGNSGADKGTYTIATVSVGTLTIDNDLHTTIPPTFTGDFNITYSVLRLQQPNVQAGDTLVISKTVLYDTTQVVLSAGSYPVVHYDPRTHRVTVLGQFANDDVFWRGLVNGSAGSTLFGEIRGGTLSNYDMAPALGSARSNVHPRAAFVGNPQWASGSVVPGILRLWGVAYNDTDDEFGMFFNHSDGYTYFSRFKANTRSSEPEVVFGSDVTAVAVTGGDIGWNGASYLAAAAVVTLVPSFRFRIRAALMNSRGIIESEVDLEPNTATSGQPDFMFGNGLEQLPGPGYGSFPTYPGKASGTVYPLVQQVKVRWNARLSRWVVAASVLWYDSEPLPSNPNVYPENGVTQGSAIISSWVGRNITFLVATTLVQPGMKLAVYDAVSGNLIAVVTVISLVGGGPTYTDVLVDATSPQIAAPQVAVRPIIREDVLCWTLGQNARGIIVEDADNVSIEDVVVLGGATDIEESWPNMARPLWQSGGQTVGQPTNVTFGSYASLTKPPAYNHRFLTPEGKVNLPKYTNVTTAGRNPYGRKRAPGERFYRSGLRGKGGI